jgi:hypothetical protein
MSKRPTAYGIIKVYIGKMREPLQLSFGDKSEWFDAKMAIERKYGPGAITEEFWGYGLKTAVEALEIIEVYAS